MRDGVAHEAEDDRRGRCVRNFAAQTGQHAVELAHELARDVSRRGEDDGARLER